MTGENLSGKITLGTVQFGLDYGINNSAGQVKPDEVSAILDYAYQSGVRSLDTSYAYGNSESVLGEYNSIYPGRFDIITKIPENKLTTQTILRQSLERLKTDKIYGYMVHNFSFFASNKEIFEDMKRLKNEGFIRKIGFSLYYPHELDYLIENNYIFDIIQIPYNLFDRRFEPYFPKLKELGVEIYVRSVFLQGLVFKKPDQLTGLFTKIKDKISFIHKTAADLNTSVSSVCLNFAALNRYIDRIVIGVDTVTQLKENIKELNEAAKIKPVIESLEFVRETDEDVLLPFNWKKN